MKYALVNNEKTEAKKGLVGYCPICGEKVVAKCGNIKINHWSHIANSTCDNLKEKETLWHRNWKELYPKICQEVFFSSKEPCQKEERHIADVCTNSNYVIEFQHSSILTNEIKSRENFYTFAKKKNMLWVIDCSKSSSIYKKFFEADYVKKTDLNGVYYIDKFKQVIPEIWSFSNVPVLLDFLGLEKIESASKNKKNLYCVMPKKIFRQTIILAIKRDLFVKLTLNGGLINKLLTKQSEYICLFLKKKLEEEKNNQVYLTKSKADNINGLYYNILPFARNYHDYL